MGDDVNGYTGAPRRIDALFELLGNRRTLGVLLFLWQDGKARYGTEIANALDIAQPHAAMALGTLREAGLVTSRAGSGRVYFTLGEAARVLQGKLVIQVGDFTVTIDRR